MWVSSTSFYLLTLHAAPLHHPHPPQWVSEHGRTELWTGSGLVSSTERGTSTESLSISVKPLAVHLRKVENYSFNTVYCLHSETNYTKLCNCKCFDHYMTSEFINRAYTTEFFNSVLFYTPRSLTNKKKHTPTGKDRSHHLPDRRTLKNTRVWLQTLDSDINS